MELDERNVVIILTRGKSDNGKHATMAFSCGLSAIAMGCRATIFLTSDGAVWGYQGSASGITVQGFPPLDELLGQYLDAGGRLVLCSVCHRTCSAGGPNDQINVVRLPETEIGGYATILELAMDGITVTF